MIGNDPGSWWQARRRELRLPLFLLLALLSASPGPVRAGSTGTTALFMPQGGGAGTANGDYVSSGLDTFYRYYLEVPPGLSRLRVQLYDADVGDGDAAEATAGRDRARNAFNTAFTYSLLDPGGATRPVRFTTGNTTTPAGADGNWLSLYDGNGRDVRDNFTSISYGNNDGTDTWAANWIETDAGGAGAAAGAIQVTGGELRLQDGVTGTPSLERQADLLGTPGLAFVAAYLSFDFRTSNNLEDADQISVQISNNGGGSWTTLETFSNDSTGSRTYDVTAQIANNTRVRFLLVGGYDGSELFFVDNLRFHDGGALTAGHWELRIDGAASTGDDINAVGIRADDGDESGSGTEINVYYDSHAQYGVNPPASGRQSRSYVEHPYVTSGCTFAKNDHDYDSNSDDDGVATGTLTLTSRPGTFSQSFTGAALSPDDAWLRGFVTGWATDTASAGYGIWRLNLTITSYLTPGVNGNYANVYFGNYQAAAPPPTANPTANSFRVYLPTDALPPAVAAAPTKPYIEQFLTHFSGPNPPAVGQTSRVIVTVRVVNPTARAITFSAANLVTANVPGAGAVYAGNAAVGQGSIVSQPAVGGTGNVTWNPGTVAAGATTILAYRVDVTPTSAGQRIPVTATPTSGNGTRAQFLDETGNAAQARATYLAGPVCELAARQGLLTQAVVSAFEVYEEDGAVVAAWQTASEAGTAGFELYRHDAAGWQRVGDRLFAALFGAPQGGTYRVRDRAANAREPQRYALVEIEADGQRQVYGPFDRQVDWGRARQESFRPLAGDYEREPHPTERAIPPAPARTRQRTDGKDALAAAAGSGVAEKGIRLAVRETGLYYLSAADLAPWLGLTESGVEALLGKRRVALSRGGEPIAWQPDLRSGHFVGLYFYGEAPDSLYTRDQAYRLERGTGLFMQTVAVKPNPGPATGSFAATRHAEVDQLPATSLALDPASDYWFWEFLQAGDATFGTRTLPLDAPGLAPAGAATLHVRLHGGTASGVALEHHATVSINGTPLGELHWSGITPAEASFPVAAGDLLPAGNQVEVTGLLDPGVPFSIFYVDAFDLVYPKLYRASADALAFEGTGALTIAGFTASPAALVDVTDPLRPRWLTGAAVGPDGAGGHQVGFLAPGFVSAAGGRYLAAAPAALRAPRAVRAWSVPDLTSPLASGDYLVIAPPELLVPAERLAALRGAQGLDSRVVSLDQVADEFGGGVLTPLALRDFLAYALAHWKKPPRYAVLAGAGSLDYRDLLGLGGNLVPPLLIAAPGGLFPADNRLAAPPAGGLPGLAIGRIPARSAAELDAYVDKLMAYEATPGGTWADDALVFSDVPDGAADFAGAADRTAALLPGTYHPERIDLGLTTLANARTRLFQGFADGISLLVYLGHGGLDRLSGGGLLASADVPTLPASERLPVLAAMTCTANRFAVPGVPALGEKLTTREGGGAVAVWAPSGLSLHGEASLLAERFTRRLAETSDQAEVRLGDLLRDAMAEFRALSTSPELADLYVLLGDPALRLKRPVPAPPAGGSLGGE